jgi:regulator of PEP synthase PpsR (kinase-PPPase family)
MLMMECGVLDLNLEIENGILLVGKTKAGKTTTSHYLTHQVLIGEKNDQGY